MCGRSLTFRNGEIFLRFALKPMTPKFQLSRDSRALYITIVAKDRLPVFQKETMKLVTCGAIDEARTSGSFLLFAYVIMPDHIHLLTDCPKTSADVLRNVKGLTASRVIDFLKQHDYQSSLTKLRHEEWKRKHAYSLWQQEKNVFQFSVNQYSCRKLITSILTLCGLSWWNGRPTIGGRARELGSGFQVTMSL
jgi:REP element-mobilizing transposase RayT